MSQSLSLFCIIHGEKYEQPFPVRINIGKTVGELKNLIKAKKQPEFDHIAPDHLELWKWNQPGDAEAVELDSSKMLNPVTKITNIFGDDPPKDKCIHIIIKAPKLGK